MASIHYHLLARSHAVYYSTRASSLIPKNLKTTNTNPPTRTATDDVQTCLQNIDEKLKLLVSLNAQSQI
jgi:hypothetical protein